MKRGETATSSEPVNSESIFLTGGSSGIGFQACLKLLSLGKKIILPCRNEESLKATSKKIKSRLNGAPDLNKCLSLKEMDLSDLNSIRDLVENLKKESKSIDTLVLNAGLQYTGSKVPRWSKQGFELTFAVNHLANHYLTKRILPLLLKSQSPRIIITSSEVHNPKSSGGKIGKPAGLGSLSGLKKGRGFQMVNGSIFNADKAYKDSKLCNILFAKELSARLVKQNFSIPVIAWAPGLVIPRSKDGFFRYSREYNELGQTLFSILARDVLRISTTTSKAGELLASLVISDKFNIPEFMFYTNRLVSPGNFIFEESNTSEESYLPNLSSLLWDMSDDLVEGF